MLDELHVKNLALIEDATLELSQGLTALTGETGAGKTALLSALRLITGQRADSKSVRDGAAEASVEARFIIACEPEEGDEPKGGEDEHVVLRRLTAQGRSRCSLDGHMATVAQLQEALDFVHIHSQHEQVRLLQPTMQLEVLDNYIDSNAEHLQPYRAALKRFHKSARALKELQDAASTQEQELDYARFVCSQMEQVKPRLGEYEELEQEVLKLQSSQALAESVHSALTSLYSDDAALDLLASASQSLARQTGVDPELDELVERLDVAQNALADTVRDLQGYASELEYKPQVLQECLSRLDELSGLVKRYGPTMEHVIETWEHSQAVLDGTLASPERLDAAKAERDQALEDLKQQATALQKARKLKAAELCAKLEDSVRELAMPDAHFSFEFTLLNGARWTETGPASVELMYQPASGVSMRPLRQIASGGELSRILLALECVLRSNAKGGESSQETLVFDEVDAGIGGATGEAIGRRLAELAEHAQVIVVTHLPQVAAQADVQFIVDKQEGVAGVPVTAVMRVDGAERIKELARMLAGDVDAAAIEHAQSLLSKAKQRQLV